MMKRLVVLLMIVVGFNAAAQTSSDIISTANNLIANNKYESAYKLLNSFDPTNKIPDVVLLKEDIALNDYIATTDLQLFAFKDLRWNEDVTDYRDRVNGSAYKIYTFLVNVSLDSLVKAYPTNYYLYKGLGDYYSAVETSYGNNWVISQDSLFKLIQKNYAIAIAHNVADDFSYYEMGYIALNSQQFKDAITYLTKAIALNKDDPDAYYNLAYSYLYSNDRDNALKNAKAAYRLYDDTIDKADAARMVAEIYVEIKDTENAIRFYKVSDEIDSGNYYTVQPLLNLYVKTNNKKAAETLNYFFNLDPENPTIYNDLSDMYMGSKRINELTDFYKAKLPEFKDDNVVTGNLYFYLAQIYLSIDKQQAAQYFIKAKDSFSKTYNPDNPVFKAIDNGLQQTDK